MSRNVLITGGAGFIVSHLENQLKNKLYIATSDLNNQLPVTFGYILNIGRVCSYTILEITKKLSAILNITYHKPERDTGLAIYQLLLKQRTVLNEASEETAVRG